MTQEPLTAGVSDEELPRIRVELAALYRDLEADLARHQPVCVLSGRCCRFRAYDHTLFLSAPEAALLLADAPPPVRPLDQGETCPWQDDRGRCNAREARPLGCRIFYCDPNFETTAPELSEEYIGRLKRVADAQHWPWEYAPLHRHLERAFEAGRFRSTDPGSGRPAERDVPG